MLKWILYKAFRRPKPIESDPDYEYDVLGQVIDSLHPNQYKTKTRSELFSDREPMPFDDPKRQNHEDFPELYKASRGESDSTWGEKANDVFLHKPNERKDR